MVLSEKLSGGERPGRAPSEAAREWPLSSCGMAFARERKIPGKPGSRRRMFSRVVISRRRGGRAGGAADSPKRERMAVAGRRRPDKKKAAAGLLPPL